MVEWVGHSCRWDRGTGVREPGRDAGGGGGRQGLIAACARLQSPPETPGPLVSPPGACPPCGGLFPASGGGASVPRRAHRGSHTVTPVGPSCSPAGLAQQLQGLPLPCVSPHCSSRWGALLPSGPNSFRRLRFSGPHGWGCQNVWLRACPALVRMQEGGGLSVLQGVSEAPSTGCLRWDQWREPGRW